MALNKRHTRSFKRNECEHCELADKRALRQGRKHCRVELKTGRRPDIRNGHCTQRKDDRK